MEMSESDTVYVKGLPGNVTAKDLEDKFGSLGLIKTDKKTGDKKIWIYRDKETGDARGDATVTYG